MVKHAQNRNKTNIKINIYHTNIGGIAKIYYGHKSYMYKCYTFKLSTIQTFFSFLNQIKKLKKYHAVLSEAEKSNAGTEGDISHENLGTCYQ